MSGSVMKVMDEICAWLKANNITPADVPITAVPKVEGGRIKTRVHLRRNGRFYLDSRGDVATGRVDVPLLVEAPAVLGPWLRGELDAP
jgi:hypothetical protein